MTGTEARLSPRLSPHLSPRLQSPRRSAKRDPKFSLGSKLARRENHSVAGEPNPAGDVGIAAAPRSFRTDATIR